jgi:hypothetical protein
MGGAEIELYASVTSGYLPACHSGGYGLDLRKNHVEFTGKIGTGTGFLLEQFGFSLSVSIHQSCLLINLSLTL